jgi:ferredoxin
MPKLTLVKNGQTYEVPAGTSFLEFCQENDAPHTIGCTVGSCGTCVSVIEAGAGNVNPREDEERETVEMCSDVPDARLGCQLVINGDVTIRQL